MGGALIRWEVTFEVMSIKTREFPMCVVFGVVPEFGPFQKIQKGWGLDWLPAPSQSQWDVHEKSLESHFRPPWIKIRSSGRTLYIGRPNVQLRRQSFFQVA